MQEVSLENKTKMSQTPTRNIRHLKELKKRKSSTCGQESSERRGTVVSLPVRKSELVSVNLKLYLFFETNYQFSKMLNFRLFQNLF